MKNVFLLLALFVLFMSAQQQERNYGPEASGQALEKIPAPKKVWVFLLAGQSNMAGRGLVEPIDTVANPRIFTINASGQVIVAKEPLHFYEPNLVGLDCGLSFGKTLLKNIPKNIRILLLPTAVGGSSIGQWLGDSTHRSVKLWSNFMQKIALGKKQGQIKAILWHQGESDANEKGLPVYPEKLSTLLQNFRKAVGNQQLPVLLGELGTFSKNPENWQKLNQVIHTVAAQDKFTAVIATHDLQHKGDKVHFNSAGQRAMGQRFAETYLEHFK